nr:peroxisomal membrane protein pex29 [Quercus suber]
MRTGSVVGLSERESVAFAVIMISLMQRQVAAAQDWIRMCIEADIILDSPPERRQVEIFELQRYHVYTDTWEPWLFSPSPHDPLSPARISGARPKGTQFFEDVQAPAAWAWKDKKWMLDLASQEWVEQRMITGVEIETQGERWVYDISDEGLEKAKSLKGGRGSTKGKGKATSKSGWEESTGLERRGDWRRRRWVRVVERKAIDSSGFDARLCLAHRNLAPSLRNAPPSVSYRQKSRPLCVVFIGNSSQQAQSLDHVDQLNSDQPRQMQRSCLAFALHAHYCHIRAASWHRLFTGLSTVITLVLSIFFRKSSSRLSSRDSIYLPAHRLTTCLSRLKCARGHSFTLYTEVLIMHTARSYVIASQTNRSHHRTIPLTGGPNPHSATFKNVFRHMFTRARGFMIF